MSVLCVQMTETYRVIPHLCYNHNIGSATVADSIGHAFQPSYIGGTFQPGYIPQRTHPEVLQYSNSHRSAATIDDKTYGTSLSPEKIRKVGEFKRLINKYSRYCTNPDSIQELAIFNSINGDDTLLDDKLSQLRYIDSLANVKF